jgi:hypothetical protein
VYRLEEIARNGAYHKRLEDAHISTVEGFLKVLNKDPNKLRKVRVPIEYLLAIIFVFTNLSVDTATFMNIYCNIQIHLMKHLKKELFFNMIVFGLCGVKVCCLPCRSSGWKRSTALGQN